MASTTNSIPLAGKATERMKAAQEQEVANSPFARGTSQFDFIRAQAFQPETGKASMFPNETPGPATPPPVGLEEMGYQRQEITRERDRPGRREEIFRDLQRGAAERGVTANTTPGGAVERGAGVFGAAFGGAGAGQPLRSGIQFGPGRTTRMPEVNSPEYKQLIQRLKKLGR